MKQYKRKFKRFTAMLLAILLAGTTTDVSGPAAGVTVYAETGQSQETGAEGTQAASGSALTAVLSEEEETGTVVGAFIVTGGTQDTDYSYSGGTLTILTATPLTIRNAAPETPTTDKIKINSGVSADITLAGVNIDVSGQENTCAFEIAEDSTGAVIITLADDTENMLKSGNYCAGLQKNGENGSLVIQGETDGTGTLAATSGKYGAGIGGGGEDKSTTDITISGGEVTATGGSYGAGIGGGYNGAGTDITISGGTVIATSGYGGAGIGGGLGPDGHGKCITISGGTVTATGNYQGAGIGAGNAGVVSDIIICGGSVKAVAGTSSDANPIGGRNGKSGAVTPTTGGASPENVYLLTLANPGNAEVLIDSVEYTPKNHTAADVNDTNLYAYVTGEYHTVTIGGATYAYQFDAENNGFYSTDVEMPLNITGENLTRGTDYSYSNGVLTVKTDKAVRISNTEPATPTTDRIYVESGISASITLAGVNIDTSEAGGCAFQIADGSAEAVTITLADSTKNILKSGNECAGLQKEGENGSLVIQGETAGTGALVATGGISGAGIGGGYRGAGTNITISGGVVTATGGISGAGIGGGNLGAGSNIVITGGSVKAVAGAYADAIGGGFSGGGSVDPTTGGNSPEKVYLLTIANPESKAVVIDGVAYAPKNHAAADEEDTNLYAYLTGEEHSVQVGDVTTQYEFENGVFYDRSQFVKELTVTGDEEALVEGEDYVYRVSGVIAIKTEKTVRIANVTSGTPTTHRIYVESDISANIILAGVNIDTSETGGCAFEIAEDSTGAVTITLADGTKNILKSGDDCAGLQKHGENGSLVIQGDTEGTGALVATGGDYGAGIGGGDGGDGTNITICGGTVTATGGDYGAGIGGGYHGAGENIVITGGSVKAVAGAYAYAIGGGDGMSATTPTTGGASPKNVYLLTVANPNNAAVIIDGAEYTPKNHTAADAGDTNLYLYLTGDRFHAVQVGTGAVAYYMYSGTEGGFLVCENLFSYTAPENLVYTGSAIELPENIITTVDGMGTVTVKYYHESSPEVAVEQPVNAGTYTIKIDIAAGGTYGSASDFTLAGWTFEVAKADKAPDMPSATMNVAYGVETVGAVTLPTGWIWAAEDASKALIVGEAVSATAVYNGADKGNYETETVEVAITRSACSHTGGTATCKDKAVCGTCGESYGTVDTTNHANTATTLSYDATGHWDDCEGCGTDLNKADHSCTSEVTKQPTVDAEGVRTYTCSTCGYSYTEAIDKLAPTTTPTAAPTSAPSATPTAAPTSAPSATPTAAPTSAPSATPTAAPTSAPSATPTVAPTSAPSATPTAAPTSAPSATPTVAPTSAPSATPTVAPTSAPSATPTVAPTSAPSVTPTVAPTATPTPTPGGSNGGNTGGSGGGGSYYPPHYPSYPTPTPRLTPTVAPTSAPTATPTLVPGIVTVPTSGENVVNEKGEAVTSVVQEPGTTTKLIIPGLTDGKPEEGEEVAPVVWESKNPDVAEVDENGKVTMKSPGLAEITVTVGEGEEAKTETVVVLVEEPRTYVNPLEEAFKDVRLGTSWTDIPLTRYQKVGETLDINFYGVKNWKQDNYQYFWRVSDETVARVDSMGHVTALKPGVVELTLALKNKTDGHFLNVQSVKIVIPEDYGNRILLGTSGKDTFDRIVLNLNERIDINFYGVKNWKKEDYEYYWSSSEPSVVWIDKLGRLTPVNPGKADIFLILVEKKTDVPRYVVPVEVTVPEKTEQ